MKTKLLDNNSTVLSLLRIKLRIFRLSNHSSEFRNVQIIMGLTILKGVIELVNTVSRNFVIIEKHSELPTSDIFVYIMDLG